MKKKICFAGFAKEELEPLKRAVARVSASWECAFVADGPAALAAMEWSSFDAVVANMDMGGVSGAELLQKVGGINARALRFIVGDAASRASIISCIGGVHQFITRPFDPIDLISTIQRSFVLDTWLSSDSLRALILKLRRLPSLPSTYFDILKQLESAYASVKDIGGVISRDPAATARLLQLVNSASLGLSLKIADPVEAVGLLGMETVKSLTLCLQVYSESDEAKQAGVSLEQLWRHSYAVGTTASRLTLLQTRDAGLASEAFTAGLLHDIGRIVIASNLPREYGAVVTAVRQNSRLLHEEEFAWFGVTHAQVGGYLLGLWGLPASLVEAVTLHHEPGRSNSTDFSILTAVHVANVFVHEQENDKDSLPKPRLDVEYLSRIGLADKPDVWRKAMAGKAETLGDADQAPRRTSAPQPRRAAARPPARHKQVPAPAAGHSTGILVAALVVAVCVALALGWVVFRKALPVHAQAPDESGRDANVPAETSAAGTAPSFDAVKLQGVFYNNSSSTAIINGNTVHVGDKIDGLVVVSIDRSSVTLGYGRERRVFRVW